MVALALYRFLIVNIILEIYMGLSNSDARATNTWYVCELFEICSEFVRSGRPHPSQD